MKFLGKTECRTICNARHCRRREAFVVIDARGRIVFINPGFSTPRSLAKLRGIYFYCICRKPIIIFLIEAIRFLFVIFYGFFPREYQLGQS